MFTRSSSATALTHCWARPDQPALPFSPKHRWQGRASDPFFLAAVVWADPASRRPPSDIPATIRYNFLQTGLALLPELLTSLHLYLLLFLRPLVDRIDRLFKNHLFFLRLRGKTRSSTRI